MKKKFLSVSIAMIIAVSNVTAPQFAGYAYGEIVNAQDSTAVESVAHAEDTTSEESITFIDESLSEVIDAFTEENTSEECTSFDEKSTNTESSSIEETIEVESTAFNKKEKSTENITDETIQLDESEIIVQEKYDTYETEIEEEPYTEGETTTETDTSDYIISHDDVTLYHGKTITLRADYSGSKDWKSSDTSIVTANKNGKINAIKPGTAYIYAYCDDGYIERWKILVKDTTIKLKSKKYSIYPGESITIQYSKIPYDADDVEIKWNSLNTNVATVDNTGKVTAVDSGKTVITGSYNNQTVKCTVTVKKIKIDISSNKEVDIFAGSEKDLFAYPNIDNQKIKWESADESIAKVNNKGILKATKAGKTVVTVRVGSSYRKIPVRVYKNEWEPETNEISMCLGTDDYYIDITSSDSTENTYIHKYWSSGGSYTSFTDAYIRHMNKKCYRLELSPQKVGSDILVLHFNKNINGRKVEWCRKINVSVTKRGIKQGDFALAKGINQQLSIVNKSKSTKIKKIEWKTSNKNIADINSSGIISGKKKGKCFVYATVSLENGKVEKYFSHVSISDPRLKKNIVSVNLYHGWDNKPQIKLLGKSTDSTVRFKSSNISVATIEGDGFINTLKTGKSIVTITVDKKVMKCKVLVSNPTLNKSYDIFKLGETTKMNLKGIAKGTNVRYSSNNTSVATVDNNGNISIKGYGEAFIYARVNGTKVKYLVGSAPDRAIEACKNGSNIYATCEYSQEKRMSDGYYDCSSLVFKSYGRDAELLGGTYEWAPTAANMALHMENTGKVIAYESINVTQMRPGDLAFIGESNNGRYLGIYHVQMYYGEQDPAIYGHVVMVARPVQ